MPILTMAIPRVKYLRNLEDCYTSVKLHLIKALLVDDSYNTNKWLKDAESPLVLNFNKETKTKLKSSDFDLIYEDFYFEAHNTEFYLKKILKTYDNRVLLYHTDIESLAKDVNEIIKEQVDIARVAILNSDEYPIGALTKSQLVKVKIDETSLLDTIEIRNENDAQRLIASVRKLGELTL